MFAYNQSRQIVLLSRLAISVTAAVLLTITPALPFARADRPTAPPPADPAIAYLDSLTTLKVMNADGSNATTIYTSPQFIQPASNLSWSPDGRSIAFSEAAGAGTDLCRIDVSVVNGVPQGSNYTVLLADPGAGVGYWSPVWSPLGDEIVFEEINSESLMAIPADGGTPVTLYTAGAGRSLGRPSWSPDGASIAFHEAASSDGTADVVQILDRANGTITTTIELGQDNWNFLHIDWARTQNKIAFAAMVNGGTANVYLLELTAGSTPQFVCAGRSPSWSPDDSELVIDYLYRNKWTVARVNLSNGSLTRLRAGQDPAWRRF